MDVIYFNWRTHTLQPKICKIMSSKYTLAYYLKEMKRTDYFFLGSLIANV